MVNAGLENDALIQSYVCASALEDAGYLLTYESTGKMDLAEGDVPDLVHGISFASTKNAITGVAEADKDVGVIPMLPGLSVHVQVAADNQAIAINDPVAVSATGGAQDGKIDKRDGSTNTNVVIGRAKAAVTINTGGTCLVRLQQE